MAVRNESVRLTLDDDFSSKAAKAAISAAALRKAIDGIDGAGSRGGVGKVSRDLDDVDRSAQRADKSINQLTGRLSLARDAILALGPGLVPIGAMAVPAVTGLANQLGIAAVAAGGLMIASQGVGDAVKALEAYRLDPTVANLEKAKEAMSELGPAAQEFAVAWQQKAIPAFKEVRDMSAAGWFPGLVESLDDLDRLAPKVGGILQSIGSMGGDLVSRATGSLAGGDWDEFFTFLETEGPATLEAFGSTVGNFTKGMAEMWMAFTPANNGFSDWLLDVSESFREWSEGLSESQGFQEFLDYLQESGPKVADFASSLVDAFVQIAEAAAPLGGPVLTVLTKFLDAIAGLADSDLGTPLFTMAAGLAVLNRSMAALGAIKAPTGGMLGFLTQKGAQAGFMMPFADGIKKSLPTLQQFGTYARYAGQSTKYASAETLKAREAVRGFAGEAGRVAGPIAGVAVASSGLADSFGLTNTASLALMGSFAGPVGMAIGAVAGAAMDAAAANDAATDSVNALNHAISASPAKLQDQVSMLSDAKEAAEDFKKSIGDGEEGFSWSWLKPSSTKNTIEGWLGDSDVEEQEKALASVEARMTAMQDAARSLAEQMGSKPITGSAPEDLAKLEQYLAKAQPALAELGYSMQEYQSLVERSRIEQAGQGSILEFAPGIAGASDELDRVTAAAAKTAVANDTLAARSQNVVNAFKSWNDPLMTAQQRAQALGGSMESLTGPLIGAVQGTDAYFASLKQMRDVDMSAGFKGQSEALRQNRAAVNQSVQALQQRMVTAAQAGAGEQRLARMLGRGREQIIASARAAGASRPQIRAYLRQLGMTPKMIRTTFKQAGISQVQVATRNYNAALKRLPKSVRTEIKADGKFATRTSAELKEKYGNLTRKRYNMVVDAQDKAKAKLNATQKEADKTGNKKPVVKVDANTGPANAALNAIQARQIADKHFTVYEHHVKTGKNAAGGIWQGEVRTFASGGWMDRKNAHPPHVAPGGTYRIFAEPETQGEAYIPFANDWRRPRAKSIVEQTVARFNGSVEWYAGGGVRGGLGTGEVLEVRSIQSQKEAKKALEQLRAEFQKSKQALKDERSARQQYATSVRESFAKAELFGNGLAGLELGLEANTNDSNAANRWLTQATKKGLDGGLLKALQASGDLNAVQQIAGLSRAEIAALERKYAASMQAGTRLGNTAADRFYEKSISKLDRTVDHLAREIKNIGKYVKKGAQDGAREGTRKGSEEGSRRGTERGARIGSEGRRTVDRRAMMDAR